MNSTNEVICPTCKGTAAMRINRTGFLQRNILGIFGIYPWKCGECGSTFLYRRRGQRSQPSDDEQDSRSSRPKHRHAVKS